MDVLKVINLLKRDKSAATLESCRECGAVIFSVGSSPFGSRALHREWHKQQRSSVTND